VAAASFLDLSDTSHNWNGGNYLGKDPASNTVKHRPVDLTVHQVFSATLKAIAPEKR
jgi:hypothetical protein